MRFDCYTVTHMGGRNVNEDSAMTSFKGKAACFAVCDGLGGHGMGDKASALVCESLKKTFEQCGSIEEFASTCIDRAQTELLAAQNEKHVVNKMKTTAAVVAIDGSACRLIHVGDTRIYHFRDGSYTHSRDHSMPQLLVMMGEITDAEIRHHPDRNKLLRALGDETEHIKYETGSLTEIRAGDAFLICSDGFWELITEAEMLKALEDSKNAKQWLLAMHKTVLENGKGENMDNNTAVAVIVEP